MTARLYNDAVILGLRDALHEAVEKHLTANQFQSDIDAAWADRARDLLDAFDAAYVPLPGPRA